MDSSYFGPVKQIVIKVPLESGHEFKLLATQQKTTMQALGVKLILDYLKKSAKKTA